MAAVALAVLIVLGIIAAIVGGGGDDDDTSTGTTTTTASATTAPSAPAAPATTAPAPTDSEAGDDAAGGGEDVHAVGDTAQSSDLGVTVLTVQDPYTPSNQFETPADGNRFVAVEVELTNDTDEPITFSSIMGAEMTDDQNRPWTIALAGTDLNQLDGDVPAKDARRGWMVFEVPQDATGLQLRVKGSITADGALFDLG